MQGTRAPATTSSLISFHIARHSWFSWFASPRIVVQNPDLTCSSAQSTNLRTYSHHSHTATSSQPRLPSRKRDARLCVALQRTWFLLWLFIAFAVCLLGQKLLFS